MDKTSKILLVLVFLALTANFFRPLFFPPQVSAGEPYQVAVLKTEFRFVTNKLQDTIQKLEHRFEKHTHSVKVSKSDSGTSMVTVKTSKPE